jgi:hypothetical protein
VVSKSKKQRTDGNRHSPNRYELPLLGPHPEDWRTLPTTKVRRPAHNSPFSWTYTYTAFSLEFARAALKRLGASSGSLIFDPFLGSGTSAVAAGLEGCSSCGVDISPFSALLARSRLAADVDEKRVTSYLAAKSRPISVSENATINSHDAAYVKGVIALISNACGSVGNELWDQIIANRTGALDSEAIAILSLALAARVTANLEKGSNPIWYRPKQGDTAEPNSNRFREAAQQIAHTIIADLSSSPIGIIRHRVKNGDFLKTRRLPKFDFCLTSPPYLNRLDYVVAHLPELSTLQLVFPISLDALKRSMIGTTKVVGKFDLMVPEIWGTSAARAMSSVLNHHSHASARYYYHTYFSYFDRLHSSILQLRRFMRKEACGLIVLQDSFYKDILIPTAQICAEMFENLSCSAEVVRSTSVQAHMGRLSPSQISYAPQKTLSESLVYFKNE